MFLYISSDKRLKDDTAEVNSSHEALLPPLSRQQELKVEQSSIRPCPCLNKLQNKIYFAPLDDRCQLDSRHLDCMLKTESATEDTEERILFLEDHVPHLSLIQTRTGLPSRTIIC